MAIPTLDKKALDAIEALLHNPGDPLPAVLKALAPNAHWDQLTLKVGEVAVAAGQAELELPLFERTVSRDIAASGSWTWSASLSAQASLSVDLLADADLEPLRLKPDADHVLIAYGAEFEFGGTLGSSGKIPAWGTVGLSAGGTRTSQVRWYVQALRSARVFEALAAAPRHFAWPYDLQALLRMAQRSDWFGVELAVDGKAHLALNAQLGKQASGWTYGFDGGKARIGLSFGLQAGVTATHAGRWRLRVMVEPRPDGQEPGELGLRVQLHDESKDSAKSSFELTAGADFSAVAASAERALRAAWPELDSPLLDSLVQPGTAIAKRLEALIDDRLDGDLQGLALLLVSGKPPAGLRSSLVGKLTGHLADVLDGALGDIASGQAKAEDLLAQWLRQTLGGAADLTTADDKLQATVADALGSASEALNGAIEDLRARTVGKVDAEVGQLLERLGEFGTQIDQGLAKLNKAKAVLAIKDALKRYSDARKKVLAALGKSQRAKVKLAIGVEQDDHRRSEAFFDAWFRASDTMRPEAERLYHALCSGQLGALPELVQGAAGVGAVACASGWLLAAADRLRKERVTLSFFGLEMGSRTSWFSQVNIQTDLVTGNLMAAKAEAGLETAITNPWKNRTARLGVQIELQRDESGAPLCAASLAGAFTARDDKTSREQVQDLLDRYCDAMDAAHVDLGARLALPPASDVQGTRAFWRTLTLAVPVRLSTTDWLVFASRDAKTVERVALQVALDQYRRRYAGDALFSDDPVADLRSHVADALQRPSASDELLLSFLQLFPERYVPRTRVVDHAADVAIQLGSSGSVSDRGVRRFMIWQRLAATVRAPLRLRDAVAQVGELVRQSQDLRDPATLRDALEPLLAEVQDALAPVALASETWLAVGLGTQDETIAWPYLSFLVSMARLAGLAVPPGFVPTAQSGEGTPVPLLAAA